MNPLWILGALAYSAKRKRDAVDGTGDTTAFLYQLPDDNYSTTRVAISSDGDDPKEVGIFASPEKALDIAAANGWNVAYGGQVLQLRAKPSAG